MNQHILDIQQNNCKLTKQMTSFQADNNNYQKRKESLIFSRIPPNPTPTQNLTTAKSSQSTYGTPFILNNQVSANFN